MDASREFPSSLLLGSTLLATFIIYKLITWVVYRRKVTSYNKLRDEKISTLHHINTNWVRQVSSQIDEKEAESINSLSFEKLQKQLQDGELTAVKALHAYQYVAAQQNAKFNFMCEPIREAEELAAKLDALSTEEKKKLPLLGIPFSVKENYYLEGYDTTVGCVHLINKPSNETSLLVEMLKAQGAVPFMRTNVPQTCMSFDSTNPIYGVTRNPHNLNRSCGGSSGGEGSAIGSGSSVLGFGSDIGGSLRIPAAFCGIYSMKPTAGRLTMRGDASIDGNERIVTITVGPMGRDVTSLIEAMKVFSMPDSHAIDPFVPPVAFNHKELTSKRRLRIGYFSAVQPVDVSETCRRAIDMAVNSLKGSGHELVYYEPPDVTWALSEAFVTNLFADNSEILTEAVKYDTLEVHIRDSVYLSYVPVWIRKLFTSTIGRLFLPQYILNYIKASCGAKSVADFWQLQGKIKEYRRRVLKELKQQEIDALICPAMPIPAIRIGECQDAVAAIAYMGLFNVLNFPTGIVPVTKVTHEDVCKDMESFSSKDMYHRAMKRNIEGSLGLPMTVQVVSLPFQEERCLRLMKELETSIGYNVLKELSA